MTATTPIRWGILGPGSIAQAFAGGVAASRTGKLVAIGARNPAKPGFAENVACTVAGDGNGNGRLRSGYTVAPKSCLDFTFEGIFLPSGDIGSPNLSVCLIANPRDGNANANDVEFL